MADVNTIAEYIYRRAPLYGIDPNLAVGIARYEGLNPNTLGSLTFGNRDARGYSFGPFQLYSGSSDPNKIAPGGMAYEFQQRYGQAPSRENWMQQVDFSLETMKNKGTNPWYAVRDQGGVEAITKKGANFAGSIGLLGGQTETAPQQPRNALIALGTNDYADPQAAAEATMKTIEAARSRGLNPVIVPPNANSDKFRPVSEAVRTAATDAGATIATGTYEAKDPLHLTQQSVRQLIQQYPGAIPIGDSNAVRIGMGLGYKPAADGTQIFTPQGQLLAQTGIGSSTIAQNIMGLPQPQMPQQQQPQQQAPATQMADVKGYLAPASAAQLAPAGTWSRFGQDVLGGMTGGLLGTPWSTPAANAAQPTQVASMAPVAAPQPTQFPAATPGMADKVTLPASVGQPTMPQMAGLNAGGGYQAPPASAMQPASQSLFNPPAAGTPMANANALAGLANVGLGLMAAGAEKPSWQPGAAAPVHRGQWRDNIFGLLG